MYVNLFSRQLFNNWSIRLHTMYGRILFRDYWRERMYVNLYSRQLFGNWSDHLHQLHCRIIP